MGLIVEKNNNCSLIYNGINYPLEKILIDFVYYDYKTFLNKSSLLILKYFKKSFKTKYIEDLQNKLINISDKNSLSSIILIYEVIGILKKYKLDFVSKMIFTNIPKIKSYKKITDSKIKKYTIKFDLNYTENEALVEIRKLFTSIYSLQDHFYEALNICLNKSHKSLENYTIAERISYYYNFNINILKNGSDVANYIEFVLTSDIIEKHNDFSNSLYVGNNIDIFKKSPSTDVISRINKPSFSQDNKKILNARKNYTLPSLPHQNKNIRTVSLIQFNNLIGLLLYCFNQMVLNPNKIFVKECQLCKRLFATRNSRILYCDRIFGNTGKTCRSGIGRRFNNRNNRDSNTNIYYKINKRLQARNNIYKNNTQAYNNLENYFTLYKNNKITSSIFKQILNLYDKLKTNCSLEDIEKIENKIKSLYKN